MEILKSGQCITILDWLSEHAGVEIYLIFESHQMSLWLCTVGRVEKVALRVFCSADLCCFLFLSVKGVDGACVFSSAAVTFMTSFIRF